MIYLTFDLYASLRYKSNLMGVPRQLTERQMKFAQLLIFGDKEGNPLSASESAYRAGYRTRPRQSAAELKNKKIYPLVANYIDELREDVIEKYGINYQKHLQDLGKLRDKSSKLNQMSAAINAEKTRGQVGGLNVERKLIKLDIDYDKLTPKELKAMLDSMYKDDNKPIKNVTPEPETIESEEEKVLEKNSSES